MIKLPDPVFAIFTDAIIDSDHRYAVSMRSIGFIKGMIINTGNLSFTDARLRYLDSCKQDLKRKFYRKLGAA